MKQIQFSFQAIALMMLTLFINACNDEDAKIEKVVTNAELMNSKNPYDVVGLYHNEFLDIFIESVKLKNGVVDRSEFMRIIKLYYSDKNEVFDSTTQLGLNKMFDVYSLNAKPGIINPCLGKDGFCKCFINLPPCPWWPWPDLPEHLLSEQNLQTNYDRTIAFVDALKAQELNVCLNQAISSEQREFELKYYAVARYSAGYWHNALYVQSEKEKWNEYTGVNRLCILCVIKADAAGAGLGLTLGGPAGAAIGAGVASLLEVLDEKGVL